MTPPMIAVSGKFNDLTEDLVILDPSLTINSNTSASALGRLVISNTSPFLMYFKILLER